MVGGYGTCSNGEVMIILPNDSRKIYSEGDRVSLFVSQPMSLLVPSWLCLSEKVSEVGHMADITFVGVG